MLTNDGTPMTGQHIGKYIGRVVRVQDITKNGNGNFVNIVV